MTERKEYYEGLVKQIFSICEDKYLPITSSASSELLDK